MVVIFCFHCLTPLELELVELVEVYSALLVWYAADIFFCTAALGSIFAAALAYASAAAWPTLRACRGLAGLALLGLVAVLLLAL